MRSYMEGKKYRENKGESAIMEKMKKYIKFARGKIFFSFYEEKTETSPEILPGCLRLIK